MLDFPNSPTTGDTFTTPLGLTYQWTGSVWAITTAAGVVASFNTRVGAVTLTGPDVTAALGYTPYSQGNPANYQSQTQLNNALTAYLPINGSVTMTGLLTLPATTPSAPQHAASKSYVDAQIAAAVAAIPAAPFVATTAGPASVTGTLTETNLAALRIPANTMGRNGVIQIASLWGYTNNANTKTLTHRFSGTSGATSGGVTGTAASATTTASAQLLMMIRNNNATNAQSLISTAPNSPFGYIPPALISLNIDTTVDTFVNLNGTLANVADTITLQHAYAVVFPHG